MTTLSISTNLAKKKAKLDGVIAAGEHVAVTIADAASLLTSTLKLRVVFCARTVAVFPLETTDAWGEDGDGLTCELNLNTQQMMKLCRAPEQGCLFILEDAATNTLHFVQEHTVKGWPEGRGDGELVDLDGYTVKVDEMAETLDTLLTSFNAHAARIDNPHGVTKGQVGLGNVNNTADADKPVSTLQQAAIDEAKSNVMAEVNGKVSKSSFASVGAPSASVIALKNWATTITNILKGA